MQVIRIEDDSDFYSLEADWNQLLKKSSNDNVFLTWDWLYTWWSFYKEGKDLCILLVKEADELLGIAPLYLCTQRVIGIPVRFLRIMGDEEVCSEYLDIIVKNDKVEHVYSLLCDYIINFIKWDVLFFSDFLIDSKFPQFFGRFTSDKALKTVIRNTTINPYLILTTTWDLYLSSMSENVKKNFKRRLNKLSKSFEWWFGLFPADRNGTLEQAMTQMMTLHENRWKQSKQYGVFKRKRFRSFHLTVAKQFCKKGWLRIFFIWVDQNPVATLYGYEYGRRLYYYQTGFDPNMAEFGIGNLVLLLSIKYSIESNLKEYDFLRGESPYKYQLTERIRKNVAIYVTRDTFNGKFAHSYYVKRPAVKAWIKSKTPARVWKYLSDTKYKRTMKG
jgi:CelD/BcsL family acetyltransferase involved in cellulose biosynthesis